MKTKAVRLYGKRDLRLEEFELPPIKEDEILVKVIADSLCMSTYKAAMLGTEHKRVPDDAMENPIIIGHEMAGEIMEVGAKWRDEYKAGERFSLQPAINYKGSMDSPGYSYKYCGGDTKYAILPPEVMIMNCLLPFKGEGFFRAALSEPFSCTIGACRSLYRTDRHRHVHYLGIKEGGRMAIIGGCGPMGLAALDYSLSGEYRPKLLIVTDLDNDRISRARKLFGAKAQEADVSLMIINTGELSDPRKTIMELTDNEGFDDMLVMVPFAQALEFGESMLGFNGCMNFFAGPTDTSFSARVNYYDVHYTERHIIGTTGGNVYDTREALELMEEGKISPEVLVTHVGGLDAVIDATLNLPELPGGKKLIYTGVSLPLTPLDELEEKGRESEFFQGLGELVKKNNGLWSVEAENYLLTKGKPL